MGSKKFGTLRTLPSGRIQARCRLKSGEQVSAGVYGSEEAAQDALDAFEVDLRRGDHWDGRKGKTRFLDFMTSYMEFRPRPVQAASALSLLSPDVRVDETAQLSNALGAYVETAEVEPLHEAERSFIRCVRSVVKI